MRSTIKIDYADVLGSGQVPAIRVELRSSDDPRDTLLLSLFESINFGERFLKASNSKELPDGKAIFLYKENDKDAEHILPDNSHGFRDFLTSKNIKWEPWGSFTKIYGGVNLFNLGREVERAKIESEKPVTS